MNEEFSMIKFNLQDHTHTHTHTPSGVYSTNTQDYV